MSFVMSFSDGFAALADSLFPKYPNFGKGFAKDKMALARDFNMFNNDLKKGLNKVKQKERIKNIPNK